MLYAGIDIGSAFFALAGTGQEVKISSMCTVFAESEIVSLSGCDINGFSDGKKSRTGSKYF